ncbi:DUF4335 domain-containing protein [Roseofilum reptotaenium CS-1145]|uniref:DUF4335 domain-containing protein n=1 Tax=Roseofilum reptotaenium AO1-A TaxID=1925591 RepID=A0A1L9QTJ1_9CYAN|nr:DUF4335 domain-containing protein [Roseofilum reptotaenium]MDB9519741.1 DUF4335 domain-containing protein [Roseofilum reptotaenium CS-1145]OJJ25907.1 hypothetical protein BI308_09235 [Roseofilum reptotaenium AO1-A]
MSIERQYNLPNCNLTLWGWSEANEGSSLDFQPLSMLSNVECQIAGVKLTGGKEFFESLVWAVSHYAQEVLSGVSYPQEHLPGPKWIHLEKLNGHYHRLCINTKTPDPAATSPNPPEVKLSDVQLFDLVEAVDQFFADTQTLPSLSWSLAPTPKRYVQATIPGPQRAAPAALGVVGLAVAAGLFLMMPIPNIERPETLEEVEPHGASESEDSGEPPSPSPNTDQSDREPNGEAALTVSDSTTTNPLTTGRTSSRPTIEDIDTLVERRPSITDATEIGTLNRRLHEDIDRAWQSREDLERDLTYRVAVGQDGAILGYRGTDEAMIPQDDQLTPLLELAYIPTDEGGAEAESIAEFKVVFRQKGVVEVSPWNGFPPGSQSLGPEITDPFLLENLNQELYNQIDRVRIREADFPTELNYRVAVQPDGEIADYEALNQAAFDYLDRTPLPSLLEVTQNSRSEEPESSDEPLAQFKVVFTPEGILQVSPWRGYYGVN